LSRDFELPPAGRSARPVRDGVLGPRRRETRRREPPRSEAVSARLVKWMNRSSFALVDPRVRVAALATLAIASHAPRVHAATTKVAAATPPSVASTDTVQLSLSDAVSRVLQRGQELRIADAQILSARGQIEQAIAPALPQVNGTVTYERQFA